MLKLVEIWAILLANINLATNSHSHWAPWPVSLTQKKIKPADLHFLRNQTCVHTPMPDWAGSCKSMPSWKASSGLYFGWIMLKTHQMNINLSAMLLLNGSPVSKLHWAHWAILIVKASHGPWHHLHLPFNKQTGFPKRDSGGFVWRPQVLSCTGLVVQIGPAATDPSEVPEDDSYIDIYLFF